MPSASRASSVGKAFLSGLWKFIAFAVLTALPYILLNLDEVGARISGETAGSALKGLIVGIALSIWHGIVIAGSTVWYNVIHYRAIWEGTKIGTGLYTIFIIACLLIVLYQPVRFIGIVMDEKSSALAAFGIAVLIAIGFCGIAYWASDHQTITSSLHETDKAAAHEKQLEPATNETNDTVASVLNQSMNVTNNSATPNVASFSMT